MTCNEAVELSLRPNLTQYPRMNAPRQHLRTLLRRLGGQLSTLHDTFARLHGSARLGCHAGRFAGSSRRRRLLDPRQLATEPYLTLMEDVRRQPKAGTRPVPQTAKLDRPPRQHTGDGQVRPARSGDHERGDVELGAVHPS